MSVSGSEARKSLAAEQGPSQSASQCGPESQSTAGARPRPHPGAAPPCALSRAAAAVSLVPLPSLRFEFPVIAALSAERRRQPSVHSQMRDSAGIQAAALARLPAVYRHVPMMVRLGGDPSKR